MKKQVWKYPIGTGGNILQMPVGAEILSIQTQFESPQMWVLVDPDAEVVDRHIEVYGTGHEISYDMGVQRVFIGTCQLHGGNLVFHVFERIS
ncbi:MAG: hypothetical protein KDC86_20005 [Saprospiraceae bacterium]|nr:hypothetical protein [Saprospiraceae bacterium]